MAKKVNADLQKFGLTKKTLFESLKIVVLRMKKFNHEYGDLGLSRKNISELIGKIMEKACADTFSKKLGYEVKRASADRDPDLTFTKINVPMEIKMTSTDNSWTGGEFSKRPFDYLMVSWGGNFDEFFCCLVHLEKENWKSNIQNNFYGPSLSAKTIYDKKDKLVFFGGFIRTCRGTIKLKRQKVVL
ncbi:hypothetical protein HYU40_02170 [Candidatus Woesearchaeota archaeon]|nr:hypothetical protein [Candidatus Woesearchaeota archaeon]